MITQEFLRSVLSYNRETGVFVWVASGSGRRVGGVAGTLNPNGYLRITISGKQYYAHRLAWLYVTGKWPDNQIDHRDTVRSNNCWSNLRESTGSENKRNCGKRSDNQSGFKGVSPTVEGWAASCKIKGKSIHLGTFASPELASAAYQEFAKEHHGEFYFKPPR